MKATPNGTSATITKHFSLPVLLILFLGSFYTGYGHVTTCNPNPKANCRIESPSKATTVAELHRFWLSLSSTTNLLGSTLVGYATGATQGVDSGIDALYFNDSPVALTSLINNVEYIIQGRALPFTDTDVVPMGFKTNEAGNYTIALTNYDGLFLAGQSIYLKDTETGIIHNLKTAPYTFSTQVGVFNTRFKIYYKSETTIYHNGTWSNGLPTIDLKAVIADSYTTATDLTAQSLTVNPGTVFKVASGKTLTVAGAITNNSVAEGTATFVVENDAAVIQTSPAANSGLFTVQRNSNALFRYDYTLWSSPVGGQKLRYFSPQTLFNRFYSYGTANGTNGDYEQELVTTTDINTKNFQQAKGYLVRMPNNWLEYTPAINGTAFEGAFTGTLTNGNVSMPLSGANAKFNLVGNPYASPISISAFLLQNAANIESTLYFYRKAHSTANAASGYATYTALGLVSADPTLNSINLTSIQTGQGFFVVAKTTTPAPLLFTNKMRTTGATTFFRSASENTTEAHRFWLNVSNDQGQLLGQTLIGYTAAATNGIDSGIDAAYFNDSATALTSLIGSSEYIIQGKSLPFTPTDVIPLGFKSLEGGSFSIALGNYDGLFANVQNIYVKDKSTHTLHNLNESDYTFITPAGIFNDRFEIQYTATLGTAGSTVLKNTVLIGVQNQEININAGTQVMDKVELIDGSGRVIYSEKGVDATTAVIKSLSVRNQLLIVRITTTKNEVITQKIVF